MTNSLYVKGRLSQPDRVIVDVGTGFYVEKDVKSAADFYEDKVKVLEVNIKDLEAIVQGKGNNLRMVEEGKSPFFMLTEVGRSWAVYELTTSQY
jgi:prefoldin alpha subunit